MSTLPLVFAVISLLFAFAAVTIGYLELRARRNERKPR